MVVSAKDVAAWYGVVPATRTKDHAVVCAHFIEERAYVVRCDSFATLGLPI